MKKEKNKKIAIIIAFRNFRDEEYFIPKEIFEKNGYSVTTASDKEGIAIGGGGGEANIDILLEKLFPKDFDAVIFAGGPGAYKYIDDEETHRIIKNTLDERKILAAICIAPAILACAGVLEGKKATVWSNVLNKEPIKILEKNGAYFEDKSVIKDGNIITANGPDAAKEFANEIINTLKLKVF